MFPCEISRIIPGTAVAHSSGSPPLVAQKSPSPPCKPLSIRVRTNLLWASFERASVGSSPRWAIFPKGTAGLSMLGTTARHVTRQRTCTVPVSVGVVALTCPNGSSPKGAAVRRHSPVAAPEQPEAPPPRSRARRRWAAARGWGPPLASHRRPIGSRAGRASRWRSRCPIKHYTMQYLAYSSSTTTCRSPGPGPRTLDGL